MFLPDRAIQSDAEDQLNRTGFAHRLAETIKDWKKDDSIVIGLFGPWGSGKSSVLNITIGHLIELTQDWETAKKPIIVWFNPWNFSEKEQLLRAFFQQVLSEIRKVEPRRSEDFKKGLENLGKALGALESLPGIGQYLGMGGKVVGLFTHDKSLKEEKENLDKLFKSLDRRIVIILDDIDRLTDEEIRLLFQIIKINADFPNTIYLAAFDREVVEKALTNDRGIQGREYLEKIVQVGFNIPRVDQGLIQRFLFTELDKVIADIDQKDFDTDRWAGLFHHGFKDLFTSVRDVKRYINSLGMTLKSVHHEVNPVDYIGLEALRVFLPEVYQGIAENKSLFLHESSLWDRQDRQQQETRAKLDEIFNANGEELSKIAKGTALQLFPQLNQVYSNMGGYGSGWRKQWREEKRICTEKFFDTYFLLGTPIGEVSQAELDLIISRTENPEEVLAAFPPYIEDGRIRRLIDGLKDRSGGLSQDQSKGLIFALLTLLSSLPDLKGELLDFGSDIDQLFLIKYLLLNLDPDERFDWFRNQLVDEFPLYASVYIVSYDLTREGEPRQEPIFSEEQLAVLKQICLERIEQYAADGTLLSQKNFASTLLRWKEWAPDVEVIKTFTNRVRSSPQTFLEFVRGFVGETRFQQGDSYRIQTTRKIDLKSLSLFLNNEEIQGALEMTRGADTALFSDEQKEALDLLVTALEKKQQNNDSPETETD